MMKRIIGKCPISRFSKFVFVGVLNTTVGYGVFAVFIFLNVHYFSALTVASVIGIVHSYFWNKYFTFGSPARSFPEFVRFVSVYLLIYVLNLLLLYVFVDLYSFRPVVVQAVVIFVLTLVSFLGHSLWSFNRRH